jgi:CSLREA domain-containing protein
MKRLTRRARLVATAFLVSVLGSVSHDSARAGVIFVTTTNDELNSNSECSLKEAIYAANFDTNMIFTATSFYSTGCLAGSGPDRIILPAQSVFLLSRITDEAQNPFGPTATPMITSNITIEADGSRFDWIGGNTHARSFAVASTGNLTLRFAHIRDFFAKGGDGAGGGGGGLGAGGAIYVKGGGQLTVEFSTFENNAAIGGNGSTDRAPNNSAGGGGGIGGNGGSGLGMGGGGGGGARGAGGAGSFFSGGQGEDVFVFGFGGGGGGTVGDGPFGGSGGNTGGFDCGGGASDQDDTAGEAGRCPGGGGGGGSSNLVGLAGVLAGGGDGGNGNYGGGGGGGGAGNGDTGGTGGFGGGGGGAGGEGDLLFSANGGNGGFGGGGGAGQSNAGHGGLYGGDAASDSSGGGAGMGGAIFNDGGSVTVRNCTFNSNFVVRGVAGDATAHPGGESGGAIFSLNGTTTVQNSTISGNAGDAGGISVRGTTSAAVTLRNTILANDGAPDCSVVGNASVAGSGNLIMSNVSCPGVVTSADPQLGSLQRTIGKTPTMAISGNSPALDTADAATSLDIDQRGVARPERNGFDIGAYERCPRSGPVLELCQDFGFIPPVDMATLTTLASPVAGGTVSPPTGEYPVNSVQPLLATSNPGYRFLSWTGNAAAPNIFSTFIVVDQPQTVTANFGTCTTGLSGRGVPGNTAAPPRVDLTWSGTSDDRYDLLRSTTSGGPYTFVGSSTTTAFSDRTAGLINNTRYYYVLQPIQLQAGGGTHTFCQSNETGVTIPRGR